MTQNPLPAVLPTDNSDRIPTNGDRVADDAALLSAGLDRSGGESEGTVATGIPLVIGLSLALGWVVAVGLAGYLTVQVNVRWGLIAHAGLVTAAMIGATLATWNSAVDGATLVRGDRMRLANWCVAAALVPLFRVVSLALPLNAESPPNRYGLVAVPFVIAAALALRASGYRRAEVGLVMPWSWWRFPLTGAIAAAGIGVGYAEFRVASTAPLVAWSAPAPQLAVAAAMLFLAALAEEFAFRGVVQRAATDLAGPVIGVLFGAALSASLGVGRERPIEVGLAFVVALALGCAVVATRSLLGAVLARGIAYVCLLVLFPHYL